MSKPNFLPLLLLGLSLSLPAWAGSPPDLVPKGRFAELHSCEVFAGPCVVNSEVDQAGNYLLRVWQFEDGRLQGVPLHGLTVALLEKGDETLAVPEHVASGAVAYLPTGLTEAQRAVLLAWARQNTAARIDEAHARVLAMTTALAPDKVSFSAGTQVRFSGATPPPCPAGGCGAMLWYTPRLTASSFAVDQLDTSTIAEPLLSMRWVDHGRQTLFVGRFGDPEPSVPALCGAATAGL